jgi:hypothetical protein
MHASTVRVFVVEGYLPLARASDAVEIAGRLERAQDALRRQGRDIRWLHTLLLPRDEAWLCVFAASDASHVQDLNRLAELTSDAILEAQLVRPETRAG